MITKIDNGDNQVMQIVSILKPDDWHVHFRDHDKLPHTVTATASHFDRALVMPNIQPVLTTATAVDAYHQRILNIIPKNSHFTPYMTLYINESVATEEFDRIKKSPHILGAKLYPAGATTNSDQGVHAIQALYPLFESMQAANLVLQIHGEVTYGDIFERESLFIEYELKPLIKNFSRLRVVLEHISTQIAVDFISAAPKNIAATITPHHLFYNRNQLLVGGIKPHYYCLPILKHKHDQIAVQQAAISGNPKFFAGTDSAPHSQQQKESACGCAGIFSAPYALSMYAQLFSDLGAIDKLEAFTSKFGANFYELPLNTSTIELIKHPCTIPKYAAFGDERVIPIAAGETLQWSVNE